MALALAMRALPMKRRVWRAKKCRVKPSRYGERAIALDGRRDDAAANNTMLGDQTGSAESSQLLGLDDYLARAENDNEAAGTFAMRVFEVTLALGSF